MAQLSVQAGFVGWKLAISVGQIVTGFSGTGAKQISKQMLEIVEPASSPAKVELHVTLGNVDKGRIRAAPH
jgi:hypothetical protein